MSQDAWSAVDAYLVEALVGPDPVLEAALETSRAAGLPPINVAPNQGKLLQLLAQMIGARRILEIGTLGGYSTIWLARALPADGWLDTLESDLRHAEVAQANLARAELTDRVEVHVGRALDTLPRLQGPYDLVFIDADKTGNPDYFAWALKLTGPGSIIVVDNVVRAGAIAEPANDAGAQATRRMFEMIAAEPRVSATAIQTVGSKGWDGVCLIRVTG
jgi:predicted O-methyltransferase YrrM